MCVYIYIHIYTRRCGRMIFPCAFVWTLLSLFRSLCPSLFLAASLSLSLPLPLSRSLCPSLCLSLSRSLSLRLFSLSTSFFVPVPLAICISLSLSLCPPFSLWSSKQSIFRTMHEHPDDLRCRTLVDANLLPLSQDVPRLQNEKRLPSHVFFLGACQAAWEKAKLEV